jgi:hypothetical protein
MAISPAEALELSQYERDALAKHEADIDNTLRISFSPDVYVSVHLPRMSERLLSVLKIRYERLGWVVEGSINKRSTNIAFEAKDDTD